LGIAIHKLAFCGDDDRIMKTLMASNEKIWSAIQKGSVVIHCLAGMHRYV
jgi:protein-tyrosine phosphatase